MRRPAPSRVVAAAVAAALATTASACGLGGGLVNIGPGGDASYVTAVLPLAYRSADGDSRPCDLCPSTVVMAPTSGDDAGLVTAFFHEQLGRYPRFGLVVSERLGRVAAGDMTSTLLKLRAGGRVDLVLVGALLELRSPGDVGSGGRAGASVYAALLDVASGKTLWSGIFDRNQSGRVGFRERIGRVVRGRDRERLSALEMAERGVAELVEHLAESVG